MDVGTAIVEAKKAVAAGLPVLIEGSPGVGKTAIPEVIADDEGLDLCEVRAGEFESVDFRGIPTVEAKKTTWNIPDFWPTKRCVINFDEISQASPELTSPLLKVFLGGRIGNYTLPEGTILFATANKSTDRAGGGRLSSALRERCVVLTIEPNLSDWEDWYKRSPDYNEQVLEFLTMNHQLLHHWNPKNDWNQPTPRNWVRVGRILPFSPAEETVAGIIGKETASVFSAWLRANVKCPSLLELIEDGSKLPKNPALLAKTVERMAVGFIEIYDTADARLYQAAVLVGALDGTFQVQFLKAIAKRGRTDVLKSDSLKPLVRRHAATIVGFQKH